MTSPPDPPGEAGLGTSGAGCSWLLLGVTTSVLIVSWAAVSVDAFVIFGPWAVVSFALAAWLLMRRPERRVLVVSAALAAVSLGFSVLGIVGSTADFVGIPVILATLSGLAAIYSVLAVRSPSDGRDDPRIWARRAALVLLLGGLVTLAGSFATWGDCAGYPCEGPLQLFFIFERSGVDFGPGLVTAALGLLIVILGIAATRGRRHAVRPEVPLIVASAALVVVGAYVVRVHVIPLYSVYGPREGVIFVVTGATAALIASVRLRRTWKSP